MDREGLRTWSQKSVVFIDRGVDREAVVHIHNGILLSCKNEKMSFVPTGTDLEIIILSEVSERQTLYDIMHTWNLRTDTDQKIFKNLWLQKGMSCGGEE